MAIGYTKISTRDYMKQTLVYALPTALFWRSLLTLCSYEHGEAAAAGSLPPHRKCRNQDGLPLYRNRFDKRPGPAARMHGRAGLAWEQGKALPRPGKESVATWEKGRSA